MTRPHAAFIEPHGRLLVVRDDLLPGGSKSRFVPDLIYGADHVVMGSAFCGGAALALAAVGARLGVRVTLFYAARKHLHPRQLLAQHYGARLRLVPAGYMTNVQAKARAYAQEQGALFMPLGFDVPAAEEPYVAQLDAVRRQLRGSPPQVWCATGTGMLASCLARAFPDSHICAVAVGLRSRWGKKAFPDNVTVREHEMPYATAIAGAAPFPCCPNYDRKAWFIAAAEAQRGALFWNVLGESEVPQT
jgi:1-aminocyclopropane-1-carboxylate deaminase/D-cysteine desulfhydrase-like pyridoxal-dependent ACC family enzyme